jgi:hypothetical protein
VNGVYFFWWNDNSKVLTMTLDHQPTYDGTPIACKQFDSNVDIGTYILFKEEEVRLREARESQGEDGIDAWWR